MKNLKTHQKDLVAMTLLKMRIDNLQLSISKGKISLQTYDAEISQIHKRYDETVKRYRTHYQQEIIPNALSKITILTNFTRCS